LLRGHPSGYCLQVAGDAEGLLQQARSADPSSPEPLQALASLRYEQGNSEEALQLLKQSMKLWFRRQGSSEEEDDDEDVDEEIPEAEVSWEWLQCAASCVIAKSSAVLQLWPLCVLCCKVWARLTAAICCMSLLMAPRRVSGYSDELSADLLLVCAIVNHSCLGELCGNWRC
jgi:hypothetical protein